MKIVMDYERKQGRHPEDVSRKKIGYDVKSDDRCIEVKGQSDKRASWIWINNSIVRNLGKDLSNYYIYVVHDMKNEPKLKILDPNDIFKHLRIDTMFLLSTADVNEFGKDATL